MADFSAILHRMSDLLLAISKRLNATRESFSAIAAETGLHATTVARIAKGTASPQLRTLLAVDEWLRKRGL